MPTILMTSRPKQRPNNCTRLKSTTTPGAAGSRSPACARPSHHRLPRAGNSPRSNRRRLAGYRDALAAAGIAGNEAWIKVAPPDHRYHTDDVEDGQTHLPELLSAGVTAVFCYNDMIAVGALLACHDGVAVPEHLSVIGFDDIEIARYVTPPLTTIHQPKLRLGELAMEMLLDILEDRQVQNHVLSTELSNEPAQAPLGARYSNPSLRPHLTLVDLEHTVG